MFRELSSSEVQARFEWARRQGYTGWLWPDLEIEAWRNALRAIARATRSVLAGEAGIFLDCHDPYAASVAGYTSGMGPLVGWWIENGRVRAARDVMDVLALHLFHNRARMAMLSDVAKEAVARLASAGVRPLIVKGMHTAFAYLPEPGARALCDVDIVLPMAEMAAAERALSGLGYRRKLAYRSPYACDWTRPGRREPRTLAYVHRDDPWNLDVQGSLNRRLFTGAQIRLDALPQKRGIWALSSDADTLRQPLLALHLASHVSQILVSATLARVTELVLVIRADTASGALCWDEFLDGADLIGGRRYVYPALVLCEQLAPGVVPAEVLSACTQAAPKNLRAVMQRLSVDNAQPLARHSVSERFMWASSWGERLRQVAGEFALDGRGQPLGRTLRSVGTKLWALRRSRYTA